MRATSEQGSDILLDSETVAIAPGWSENTPDACALFRVGQMVTLALRVNNAAGAAKLIAVLPPPYRPAAPFHEAVEVKTNGEVLSMESLAELSAPQFTFCTVIFRAASIAP